MSQSQQEKVAIQAAMRRIKSYRARQGAISDEETEEYESLRKRVNKFLGTTPGFLQIKYGYRLGNVQCAIEGYLSRYAKKDTTSPEPSTQLNG